MFQGCTTSPVLFNTVMHILLDIMKCESNLHLAYEFQAVGDAAPKSVIAPTFADDLAVVTKSTDGVSAPSTKGNRFAPGPGPCGSNQGSYRCLDLLEWWRNPFA